MGIEPDQGESNIDTAVAIERALAVAMLVPLLAYLLTGTFYGYEQLVMIVEISLGILGIWILLKKGVFIQEDYELEGSKQKEIPIGPCGNCGEDFRHPILSADGKYRCPKCAKPVEQADEFFRS
ncbi:MAG: hypothetical protein ACFFC0_07200 [Promethearchaeota archaeon]